MYGEPVESRDASVDRRYEITEIQGGFLAVHQAVGKRLKSFVLP